MGTMVLLILASPVIYVVYLLVRLIIVDPIVDKVEDINSKKYYGEKELIYVTTYQNDDIYDDDIMNVFLSQWKLFKKRYFICEYKVYSDKDKQKYAWSMKTTKETYGWGIVYNLAFHFSNGWVHLLTSNSNFSSGGMPSNECNIVGYDFASAEISKILNACKEEAFIMWKKNNIKPTGFLPFSYRPLYNNYHSSSKSHGKQKEEASSNEKFDNSTSQDILNFYRNLLGLKYQFSQIELKNAYREAAIKYHPDSYGSSSERDRKNAEVLMIQVNEAYATLKKYKDDF